MKNFFRNGIIFLTTFGLLSGCAALTPKRNLESKMNHAPIRAKLKDGRTSYEIPDFNKAQLIKYLGLFVGDDGKTEYHTHVFFQVPLAGKKVNALVFNGKKSNQICGIRIDWNDNWNFRLTPEGVSRFKDPVDYELADEKGDGIFNKIAYGRDTCKIPKWAY